jgi:hypothetical protein
MENIEKSYLEKMKMNIELFLKIKNYFERQYKLLQGFEKNPEKLKIHSNYLEELINDIEMVIRI